MTDRPKTIPEIVSFERVPTDAERAAKLKAQLRNVMTEACGILNEGKEHGLTVNFNISPNAFGFWVVNDITVVKPL